MRALSLLLLLFLSAGAAAGQSAATNQLEPYGVTVVKARWQKQVYGPQPVYDALDAESDRARLERDRKETVRTNNVLTQLGRDPIPPPSQPRGGRQETAPSDAPSTAYLYEVKVSNNGTKKIRSLVWEYVLFEPDTQREVGHHPFESKVTIEVGKTKSLTGWSTVPPATAVHVTKSDKEARGQYAERVDIHRVVYEDGTVWERQHK